MVLRQNLHRANPDLDSAERNQFEGKVSLVEALSETRGQSSRTGFVLSLVAPRRRVNNFKPGPLSQLTARELCSPGVRPFGPLSALSSCKR